MFADPCMGNKLEFEPVAPAITMAGVVIVFIIDFSSTRSLLNAEGAKVTKDTPTFNVDFNTTSNDKKGLQKSGTASSDIELAAPAGVVRDLTVDENRKHWEVNMLEGGTVFHSFLVGLTIGAQGGQAFVSLCLYADAQSWSDCPSNNSAAERYPCRYCISSNVRGCGTWITHCYPPLPAWPGLEEVGHGHSVCFHDVGGHGSSEFFPDRPPSIDAFLTQE